MKRVLHIVGTMNMGGQETFIMNIYRNIDRGKYQFDFVVHSQEKGYYDDEIEKLGGKIYRITPISKNPFKHMAELYSIIKNNNYEYVHRHTATSIVFVDLMVAKHIGVKKVILHSHNSFGENKILHSICKPLTNIFSDVKLACSELAGTWLFGKNKSFTVIPNAIDIEKFKFDSIKRKEIRLKYNIDEDTLLIGNVGAFRKQKNQIWLIETFKRFIQQNPNSKLMICGDGQLRNEIEKAVKNNNLLDKIILTGNVNTADYYNAFDLFVLPSIYEGLGIVLIEAQISNLPCIVSNAIQDEAIISTNVSKLNLIEDDWIREFSKFKVDNDRKNLAYSNYSKYDINRLVKIMKDEIYN